MQNRRPVSLVRFWFCALAVAALTVGSVMLLAQHALLDVDTAHPSPSAPVPAPTPTPVVSQTFPPKPVPTASLPITVPSPRPVLVPAVALAKPSPVPKPSPSAHAQQEAETWSGFKEGRRIGNRRFREGFPQPGIPYLDAILALANPDQTDAWKLGFKGGYLSAWENKGADL